MLTETYVTRFEGTLVVLLVEELTSVEVKALLSANPPVLEENAFRSELEVDSKLSSYKATG